MIKAKSGSLAEKINFEKPKKIEVKSLEQAASVDTPPQEERISKSNFFKTNIKYLKNSLPYYWHTGEKKIALGAGAIGVVVSILFLIVTVGQNAIVLILALMADKVMVLALLLYLFFVRQIGAIQIFMGKIDAFFLENFIYILIGILLNRVIINVVAEKVFKYNLIDNKSNSDKY